MIVSSSNTKYLPNVIGSSKFKFCADLLKHPFYSSSITIAVAVFSWVSLLQGWIKDSEYQKLLFIASILIIIVGILIPIIIKILRFSILSNEVKNCINSLPINQDTLIFGVGGGSYTAIGILLKAWEKKSPQGDIPPDSICISMKSDNSHNREFFPSLQEISQSISNKEVLIVLAQIGTGRTARELVNWAENLSCVNKINIFSLIISEPAADSGDWSDAYTLAILNRNDINHSILPWISTTDEY